MQPHFTEANAHRHLLVLSKEHYEGKLCRGWWAQPTGLFRRAMRLCYSTVQPEALHVDDYMQPERDNYPVCESFFHIAGCDSRAC